MVHGVVVQMTTFAPSKAPFVIINLTQIVGLLCSRYSISASAKAVFSTGDHITGFEPWYKDPFIINFINSSAITASEEKSIVRYGFSQSPITPSLLNSLLCTSTQSLANFRHSPRNSFTGTSSLFKPLDRYFSSIFHSIGKPWQSHPGI